MSALRILRMLLDFLRPFWKQAAVSVVLGVATIASGIGLLGTSAYLIASAALHPSIAELEIAVVGVRFFGISRALFRYLERLVSHSVNFRLLAGLRSWFYSKLEPLAPARLQDVHSADLLSRAVADIDTLENFYVRAVTPPLVAFITILGASLFIGRYDPRLGLLLATALLISGVG
jgi:ATP-binding cassette, subfamily C, bacterial CydC